MSVGGVLGMGFADGMRVSGDDTQDGISMGIVGCGWGWGLDQLIDWINWDWD